MGRKGNVECSIEGCEKKELARGLCPMHYNRLMKTGDPGEASERRAQRDPICSVEGCEKPQHAKGFCPTHLGRFKSNGDPLIKRKAGRPAKTVETLRREAAEGAPGGSTSPKGYRYRTGKRGERYAEHRLVMEYHLGRALLPDESPHHRYGDRSDNRIESLELWTTSQPPGQRVEDKIAWAQDFLTRYAPTSPEILDWALDLVEKHTTTRVS